MEELENLKRMNKNNNSASNDQLSYSQTINLNNLKSNDNLKSISDISAMNRKIAMEQNSDQNHSQVNLSNNNLKVSYGKADFDALVELDNSHLFSLKKEKENQMLKYDRSPVMDEEVAKKVYQQYQAALDVPPSDSD